MATSCSGGDAVLLAGRSGAVVFLGPADDECADDVDAASAGHHLPVEPERLDWITTMVRAHFGDLDVVLAEGYAPLHDALVEVQRTGVTPKPTGRQQPIWLTVTDEPNSEEYHFDQLAEIAHRIIELMESNRHLDGADRG